MGPCPLCPSVERDPDRRIDDLHRRRRCKIPLEVDGSRPKNPRLPRYFTLLVQISLRAPSADSLTRRFLSLLFSISAATAPSAGGPIRLKASITVCRKRRRDSASFGSVLHFSRNKPTRTGVTSPESFVIIHKLLAAASLNSRWVLCSARRRAGTAGNDNSPRAPKTLAAFSFVVGLASARWILSTINARSP